MLVGPICPLPKDDLAGFLFPCHTIHFHDFFAVVTRWADPAKQPVAVARLSEQILWLQGLRPMFEVCHYRTPFS